MARRLLQIIQAQDWFAQYQQDGRMLSSPVACWVLVEEDAADGAPPERDIVGWDGDRMGGLCDEIDNFIGYVHAAQILAANEEG